MSSKSDPKKKNTKSEVSRSGHIWQVCDNPDKPYQLIQHKDGHHVYLRQDGSVQIKAVKVPADNPNSGKLLVHAYGDALIKVEQDANIEVGGACTLEVDGQLDVHAYKDINMRSEGNINFNAAKNFTVNADQSIILNGKSKVVQNAPKVEAYD